MKVITIRSQIREVAERWNETHKDNRPTMDRAHNARMLEIPKKLAGLDPETATAADVEAIIGNDSWACPQHCDECCKEECDVVVSFEREGRYEGWYLCRGCIEKAYAAMRVTPPEHYEQQNRTCAACQTAWPCDDAMREAAP